MIALVSKKKKDIDIFGEGSSSRSFTVMSAAAPCLRTYTSLRLQSHHSLPYLYERTLSSGAGFTAHLWYFYLECDFKGL